MRYEYARSTHLDPAALDAAFMAQVRELHMGALYDPNPANKQACLEGLRPYDEAHGAYLTDVASHATARAGERGSGMTAQSFNSGEQSLFSLDEGVTQSELDLASLGLPPIGRHEIRPFAVVLHQDPKVPQKVVAVEALGIGQQGVTRLFLENPPAANINDTSGRSAPRWVTNGDTLLSRRGVVVDTSEVKERRGGKGMLTVASAPVTSYVEDGSGNATKVERPGRATILRPAPNKVENLAAKPAEKRGSRLVSLGKKLGATALAAIAFSLAPIQSAPEHDIDSAKELVLEGHPSSVDGIYQAESGFDDEVLGRSREAFTAYDNKDTAGLKKQMEANGYQPDWISAESFADIRGATTFGELEAAFHKAVGDLPVKLKVPRSRAEMSDLSIYYEHALDTDLGASKQYVAEILTFYNLFDKEGLQKVMASRPLAYELVGKIKGDPDKHPGTISDPDGYAQSADGEGESIIVLDVNSHEKAEIAAHEWTHYLAAYNGGELDNRISRLNPAGHTYVGTDNSGLFTTSYYNGQRVVARGYGQETSAEDTATVSEDVFKKHPEIELVDSPYTEKLTALIFTMERLMPGFTASFLQHARVEKPSVISRAEHGAWRGLDALQNNTFFPSIGLYLLAASMIARGRRNQAALKAQGIEPPKVTNAMVYDHKTNTYIPVG